MKNLDEMMIKHQPTEIIREGVKKNALEMADFLFGLYGYGDQYPDYWKRIREYALLWIEQTFTPAEKDLEAIRMLDCLFEYCRKYKDLKLIEANDETAKKELIERILNDNL